MSIRIASSAFDPSQELRAFMANRSNAGALASFVGLARDATSGAAVTQLVLEHYPGFTEAEIARMEREAGARYALIDTLVVHRVGAMAPGEPIVLCAALAAHRKPALEAVDFLMDHLKTDAPFWKREIGPGGARWIEPRAEDYAARKTWETS